MTMFDGYEEMDLYDAMIRDDTSILSIFISKIDELKKVFSEQQIKLLRTLVRADLAISKNELEKIKKELQYAQEEELMTLVK